MFISFSPFDVKYGAKEAPFELANCTVFESDGDIVEDRTKVVEWFAKYLVTWEGDDQVATVFADADAGWVDECCIAAVVVFVFHFETPLFVSGCGPKPFSR